MSSGMSSVIRMHSLLSLIVRHNSSGRLEVRGPIEAMLRAGLDPMDDEWGERELVRYGASSAVGKFSRTRFYGSHRTSRARRRRKRPSPPMPSGRFAGLSSDMVGPALDSA
jgi:hypothetical protein